MGFSFLEPLIRTFIRILLSIQYIFYRQNQVNYFILIRKYAINLTFKSFKCFKSDQAALIHEYREVFHVI